MNYKGKWTVIFGFAIIPVVIVAIFTYYPILNIFFYSTTDWNGIDETYNFIGLDNYRVIFTDPQYLLLFRNTLYYLLFAIPQIILGLILAIFINGKFKGEKIYKGIIIFPYVINGVIVSSIFILFFREAGLLNFILSRIEVFFSFLKEGSLQRNWLLDYKVTNQAIASISIWKFFGFNLLMFLGALQSITKEVYEAARIDGANKWHEIIHIILPSIKKIIFINIILSVSGAIQTYEFPFIMTGGTGDTATPVIQINQSAFSDNRLGFAAALSVVVFIVVVIAISIQRAFIKDKKYEW